MVVKNYAGTATAGLRFTTGLTTGVAFSFSLASLMDELLRTDSRPPFVRRDSKDDDTFCLGLTVGVAELDRASEDEPRRGVPPGTVVDRLMPEMLVGGPIDPSFIRLTVVPTSPSGWTLRARGFTAGGSLTLRSFVVVLLG